VGQHPEVAGVLARARAGNRPGRHAGDLGRAQAEERWRDGRRSGIKGPRGAGGPPACHGGEQTFEGEVSWTRSVPPTKSFA
jgi:hypothetical protein